MAQPVPHPAALKAFDAIDHNNFAGAEIALEPALAKDPNEPSLRAAQAMLLLATQRSDEAIEVAVELAADNPIEPKTVNAMIHVLQQTAQWAAVSATYQRVIPVLSAGVSGDKSATENLAMTFARMHRYSEMQRECAKLSKETGQLKFTLWSAMANLLTAPEGDPNSILLKLVTRVLDKQVLDAPSGQITLTPEHSTMYLEALVRQNAHDAALDFVASKRFKGLGPADRLHQYARVARGGGGKTALVAAVSRKLWEMDVENWTYFTDFVDSVNGVGSDDAAKLHETHTVAFEGEEPVSVQAFADGESTPLDVAAALISRQKDPKAPPRGLLLEKMELLHRAGADRAAELDETVKDFCLRNASRPSCFLDVIKYVRRGAAPAWLSEARPAGGVTQDTALLDHSKNAFALQLVGSVDTAVAASDAATVSHLQELSAALAVCPLPAELGDSAHPWPQLLSAACNAVARRMVHVGDAKARAPWAALGCRLAARAPARHKFPMIHLFAILFAHSLDFEDIAAVDALDLKSVQLDSMAFFCLRPLKNSHDMVRAFHYAAHAHQWYGRFERDTGNLVAKAFQNCAWTQLRELRSFENVVANSVSRAEWYALYTVLLTLSSENQATLLSSLRGLRMLKDVIQVDPSNATVNDDRNSVAAAAFLEMPRSEFQGKMLDVLMPVAATPEERSRDAHGICAFFLILRDLSAFVSRALAPKPAGGKKAKKAAAAAAPEKPLVFLVNDASLALEERVARVRQSSELLVPIVKLIKGILASGAAGKADVGAVDEAVAGFVNRCGTKDGDELRQCLWPAVPVVVSSLRALSPIANKAGVPVKKWATSLSEALHAAESFARDLAKEEYDCGEKELVDLSALGLDAETPVVANLRRRTFVSLSTAFKGATLELDTLKAMR